uniref:Choline transporter-like protein n=1 Tax=Takifugu rubripes TaxID=31033 RepID=A0A674NNW4_TAKRU
MFTGPIKKRGCTDIVCCVLFMAVVLGYLAVGILAWLYGDPRQVLYPKDSTGWFCGIGKNADRPHLFYFDILKCATTFNVMAAALNGLQCPTTQVTCVPPVSRLCPACVPPVSRLCPELCPYFHIPSTPGDICLLRDIVNGLSAKDISVRIFEDFASAWPWILLGLVLAMLVSMLFLLLLRFTAPVMVWVLIAGLLAAGAYGIWHCYWEYDNYKQLSASITDVGFTTNFSVYLQVQETWLAFLIIISVAEAVILLTLIFLRKRILIAIALIQEASKAIGHMMSCLLYPLVTFVLLLVCVAYWGTTALYPSTLWAQIFHVSSLSSAPPQTFTPSDYPECPSARCIFIKYNDEGLFQRNLFNLQIYNVVAFLWCANFVIALGQCTLAGAFSSYYWAFTKPDDIPTFPVCSSFIRSLRYHVGSLAFGALILTLVQIVRIILEYIDHKTKSAQNPCARFLLCCLKCCFWCLEKFIKFLNRNAYIMIAVYGKNFCVSAKNAFMLLMRNIVRVVVLDKVTDLLLFFGKLLVVGGVGVLAFFFFSGRILLPGSSFQSETLNYYWMPIITVVVGSYLIAHGFFSVYNMCVDTLFLCFLEDLERNDGSLQKPYFMSRNLMKILNKSNKAVCVCVSHTQQPEEKEDGNEEEERVLPVVIAVVDVTVAMVLTCILVWGGEDEI